MSVPTVTTPIQVALSDDGYWVLKAGDRTLQVGSAGDPIDEQFAREIEWFVRSVYARGRKDERAQTAAVLRGLLSI